MVAVVMSTRFTEVNGWMPDVEHVPTIRISRSGVAPGMMYPHMLVQHCMQGTMVGARTMMSDPDPNWWMDRSGKQASWHFSIGRDGSIMQHASIWDTCWHAGVAALADDPVVRALQQAFGVNPNAWSVGIEHEGFSKEWYQNNRPVHDYIYGPDRPYPEAMIASSIRVQRWIWNRCQWLVDLPFDESVKRFVSHSQIDPAWRSHDPGVEFDTRVWDKIVNGVLVPSAPPKPAPPTPPVPIPVPVPPAPTPPPVPLDYNRGRRDMWNDVKIALDTALESTREPWE